MSTYVGSIVRLVGTARGYPDASGNTVALTPPTVGATISVATSDATPVVLVDEAAMTWDDANQRWYYDWLTTGLEPGTYQYIVTVAGGGYSDSSDPQRIRLKVRRF